MRDKSITAYSFAFATETQRDENKRTKKKVTDLWLTSRCNVI